MKTRRLAVAAVLAASAVVACQVIIGIENERGGPPDPEAGAGDAGDADVKSIPTCEGALPGNRARLDDGSVPEAGIDVPFFFATRKFVFRPMDRRVIGFNLDGICTGIDASAAESSLCTPPSDGGDLTDVDGGVDNAFGSAFRDLGVTGDLGASVLADNVDAGSFTIIIQLTNWNGTPTDNEVNVEVLTGGSLLCPGCDPKDAGDVKKKASAAWDGGDRWMIRGRKEKLFPTSGANVAAVTYEGAIKNGVLSVTSKANNDRMLSFAFAGSKFDLLPAMIYAELTTIEGHVGLTNGVIAGVARASDILSFGGRIYLSGNPVCKDPIAKPILFDKVCNSRDSLRENKIGQPCDAVSFAFEFTALPVLITDQEALKADDPCEDAGFDPTCP